MIRQNDVSGFLLQTIYRRGSVLKEFSEEVCFIKVFRHLDWWNPCLHNFPCRHGSANCSHKATQRVPPIPLARYPHAIQPIHPSSPAHPSMLVGLASQTPAVPVVRWFRQSRLWDSLGPLVPPVKLARYNPCSATCMRVGSV